MLPHSIGRSNHAHAQLCWSITAGQYGPTRVWQNTIASNIKCVIMSFISAGRAKRGWTSQHNVVKNKPILTSELVGLAERPSSQLSILIGGNDEGEMS